MASESDGKKEFCARFAMIAIKKNFINAEQAKEALSEQLDDNLNDRPHRLIGEIMMEKGWITAQQIAQVLIDLAAKRKD